MADVFVVSKLDPNILITSEWRAIGSPVRTGTIVLDTDFGEVAKAIYVGGTGNLSVRKLDGTDQTFIGVASGGWFQIVCVRINTAGTTATNLVWGS